MKQQFKLIAALALAGASALSADFIDFGEAPPEWENAKPNTELGKEVLGYAGEGALQGRLLFNQRLRYEYADAQGLESANAFTLRTRVGYESPKLYGLYFVGEFENTWAMNYQDYRAFPIPQFPAPPKTVIADPRNNELNQLFIGFKAFNSELKGGRQEINLDNQRFVGAVAWRQNEQTFDAVRFTTEVIQDVWLSYAWDWRVNRIFGVYAPETPSPAAPVGSSQNLERFLSNNHFVNVHYNGLDFATIGSYFYYIDLDKAPALSGNTFGLFIDGKVPLADKLTLPFRAEYAFQTDNSGSSAAANNSFWFNYWHAILGVNYTGYEVGFGFENLGGNSMRAFQTPLATLHKFNGWADVFLTTPTTPTGGGLQDYYIYFKAPLPFEFKANGAYHYFTAANSSRNYGQEFDIGISRKITDNLSGLIKAAYYDGHGGPTAGGALGADVTKVWVQFDFKL